MYSMFLAFLFKPENLLCDTNNGITTVKLTDFGDARHIYNNYYVHAASGDPEFLAPEIVTATPVGLLSDMWYETYNLMRF